MSSMTNIRDRIKKRHIPANKMTDFVALAVIVFALIFIGGLALSSASAYSGANMNAQAGDGLYFMKRQAAALFAGLIMMYFMYRRDYHTLQNVAAISGLVSIALLVYLHFSPAALDTMGAKRGFTIGPIGFQPTELAKISLAIWATGRAIQLREKITDIRTILVNIGLPTLVLGGLVLLLKDLGSATIICFIGLLAIYLAGARTKHMAQMIFYLVLGGFLFILIEPYRRARIVGLLNPEGTSAGAGYQLTNSLYALASGNWSGVGFFNSHQKYGYIPAVHTDFIFSVWGEEFGFIGAAFLVSLFFAFFLVCLRISAKADHEYGRNLAIVIGGYICVQVSINLLSVVGLFPVTGVPLPLISYGGTSLFMTLLLIGILFNISTFPTRRRNAGGEKRANTDHRRRYSGSPKSRSGTRSASN